MNQTNVIEPIERLFALSPDLLCIANTDGFFKQVSPSFTETLGWSTDELLARPFLDLVHPDDRAATIRVVETLASGQPLLHFENRYQHKDGSWRTISWRCTPQAGGALYACGRDVTERRRNEQQVTVSVKALADFKAALDEHAIVAITDARGKITYVNDKFCAISQYAREELLGQDHRIINSGHHPKAFIRDLWTTITSGKVWQGELKNRAKDGSFYWVDTTIVPFLDAHGEPVQFIAIRADITERKRVEARMADLERALDEHAIVAITDARGKITYVNDRFSAISKYAREELLGQEHRIISSGHHPKAFIRDLWTTINGGKVWHGELKNRAKDGSFYWVHTTIVPFLDAQGKPVQFIGIQADITERKEFELRIAQLNAELVSRADLLTEANKELEAFSYSVSHDLRAPLRHAQGFLQMLEKVTEGKLEPKAREFLQIVAQVTKEMGHLIDDLLAFSRLGRVGMKEQTVDLNGLVQDTIKSFELLTRDRSINWRIAPLPPAMGDSAMLRQVLANLIGNAIKYSSQRNPAEIEIGLAGEEAGRLILFVRDNGAGFDMRYAAKLFGVFQRLHRAEDFEGTGIGLALVRRIITRHGGRTWAHGEPGKGATFFFTLRPAGPVNP